MHQTQRTLLAASIAQDVVAGDGREHFLGELRAIVRTCDREHQGAGLSDLAGIGDWSAPGVDHHWDRLVQGDGRATEVDAALRLEDIVAIAAQVEAKFGVLGVVKGWELLAAQDGPSAYKVRSEGDVAHTRKSNDFRAIAEIAPELRGHVDLAHAATHEVQDRILRTGDDWLRRQVVFRHEARVEAELLLECFARLDEFVHRGAGLRLSGFRAGSSDRRQQKADQDHDDPDHDEQFGESETDPDALRSRVRRGGCVVHRGEVLGVRCSVHEGLGPEKRVGRPKGFGWRRNHAPGRMSQIRGPRAEAVSPRSSVTTRGYVETASVCSNSFADGAELIDSSVLGIRLGLI